MARKTRHNPERRAWKGRSYKAAGRQIQTLKEQAPSEALCAACDDDPAEPGTSLCKTCNPSK